MARLEDNLLFSAAATECEECGEGPVVETVSWQPNFCAACSATVGGVTARGVETDRRASPCPACGETGAVIQTVDWQPDLCLECHTEL